MSKRKSIFVTVCACVRIAWRWCSLFI